jgi:hypothetical protein
MTDGPALKSGDSVFPISGDLTTVGRRNRITAVIPDIDVTDLDTTHSISRSHAEFVRDGEGVMVRDVGSTNGTSVNGKTLANGEIHRLADGDKVSFGALSFTYHASIPRPDKTQRPPTTSFAAVTKSEPALPVPDVVRQSAAPDLRAPSHVEMCSVHEQIPAAVICPGCLQNFCMECAPITDGPVICRSCSGIQRRLSRSTSDGATE